MGVIGLAGFEVIGRRGSSAWRRGVCRTGAIAVACARNESIDQVWVRDLNGAIDDRHLDAGACLRNAFDTQVLPSIPGELPRVLQVPLLIQIGVWPCGGGAWGRGVGGITRG